MFINIAFIAIAIIALFNPQLDPVFWNDNQMSLGDINFRRLKLLTYEPSYYSLLLAPIAFYYLIKIALKKIDQPVLYFVLLLSPMILSLSFGVILGMILAFALLVVMNAKEVLLRKTNLRFLIPGIVLVCSGLAILWVFFPNNIFFLRITNTLSGKDLSFNGRTFDSFILGIRIACEKSFWWGTGLGQVKLIGLDFFKKFYHYDNFTVDDIGIPNNVADILATFGMVGVIIKLCAEIYFYRITRVATNYYRQSLFLFVFIYQFTGSYIMNIAEYAIWVIAFKQNIFTEFDKPVKHQDREL
ncbi:MAG: O-antigen ligase family protein [Chitinophagaceae bacterium]|nr:O-antigen ligase family protein [Chitinophagaceae bacterium]